MDTTAYLHSQGWLGTGHALSAHGLSKPLLVSQKQNVLGVGKKRHDAHADQWWARAFDGCLKGLEVSRVTDGKIGVDGEGGITGEGEDGDGGESGVRVQGLGAGFDALRSGTGGRGGLYGFFVRGEGLRGTFGEEAVGWGVEGVVGVETKSTNKSVDEEKAERRRRRKARRDRRERSIAEAVSVVGEEVSDEGRRKRLRKERRKRRRGGEDAEDGAVTAAVGMEPIERELYSSPQKKKRRTVAAGDSGSVLELATSGDRVATEISVSGNRGSKATNEADHEAMQGTEKSSVEMLERRRRKAARKALEAELSHSVDGQAGQENDGMNTAYRKGKRKHTII